MSTHFLARSPLVFPAVLTVTLIISLLPPRWLGWAKDVAQLISLPLQPIRMLGGAVESWMRNPIEPQRPLDEEAYMRQLEIERDRFERLLRAEQLRVQELEQRLSQLQKIPTEVIGSLAPPRVSRITSRDGSARAAVVEIQGGSKDSFTEEMVAVFDGVHLVGRVTEVQILRSFVTPITNPATGLLRVIALPADKPEMSVADAPTMALEPTGEGTFFSDVDRSKVISVGDEIRLADQTWPAFAQAMVIGTVTEVRPKEDQPLRVRVIVEPTYQLSDLPEVTLLRELKAADGSPQ